MSLHITEFFEEDEDDFWSWKCECGETSPPFPSPDIAADAFGDHCRVRAIIEDRGVLWAVKLRVGDR